MKNLHYAFAHLHYYKKKTVFTIILFSLLLILLNMLLNLIDINKAGFNRLMSFSPEKAVITSYQNWNLLCTYGYIGIVLLLIFMVVIASYFEVLNHTSTIQKWRLLGFSDFYILKQNLLETLILVFGSAFIVSVLLLTFQEAYESVLFNAHRLFQKDVFLSGAHSITFTESLPVSTSESFYGTTMIIPFDYQNLSLQMIFKEFSQNLFILLGITVSCSIIFTSWGIQRSKISFRK